MTAPDFDAREAEATQLLAQREQRLTDLRAQIDAHDREA